MSTKALSTSVWDPRPGELAGQDLMAVEGDLPPEGRPRGDPDVPQTEFGGPMKSKQSCRHPPSRLLSRVRPVALSCQGRKDAHGSSAEKMWTKPGAPPG
jgi:hypothetical protein